MHQARECGICGEGYEDIRNCKDVDELLQYYVKTIDWSLENGFPTLNDIRTLFNRDALARNGIFVDRTFDGDTFFIHQAYVFHNCKGHINVAMDYENANIPMLYFANGCEMSVGCEQANVPPIKVPLYVFGDCHVDVIHNDNAKFTIFRKEVKHE